MPDAVHHHAIETDDIDVAREVLRATYASAELASGAFAGFRYLEASRTPAASRAAIVSTTE